MERYLRRDIYGEKINQRNRQGNKQGNKQRNYSGRKKQACRRKRRVRRVASVVLAAMIFVFGMRMFCDAVWKYQFNNTDFAENSEGSQTQGGIGADAGIDAADDIEVDLEHLYSPYAILVDLESGKVLASHNGQDRIYPASLTKIMTALLAIENTDNMDESMTMPEDLFQELYAEDASMAGFLPGENVYMRDLLYGILLPSGAECCLAFAERIAGSEEAFVDMMNQKAAELGMVNTHFCNCTGLHNPEHYSTVEDMSVLLQYALKNDMFKTVFTTSRYSVYPSNCHPDGFTFYSTMFQGMDSPVVTGGQIIGGKTGYTGEAGLCLASLAEIGGKEYILVTAKADGNHQTEQFHILDAINVYNQIGQNLTYPSDNEY